MTTLISFIILLGILIFVHELGHFLVARMSGVGVQKFSLGFGPKIIGRTIGETEYVLSWIPLGGYVKLMGESGTEELSPEDEKRSFARQNVWKRIMIVAAGPAFNFLLAVVIFIAVMMYGLPTLTSDIGEVQKDSAAYQAGMLNGDKIIYLDGKKIALWEEIRDVVARAKDRQIEAVVQRGKETVRLQITPKLSKSKNLFGEDVSAYLIGVSPAGQTVIERKSPVDAVVSSVAKTWEISKLTVISVIKIFEGVISPKTLGGPIFIAQVAGAQVREGIIPFVLFMAILSINLGVINLFPIPVLDGGHILFYLIEVVTRREVSAKVREMSQQIGFVVLLMLMLFVIFIDIERLNIKFVNDVVKFFK
ncbi:MAG TPA: RIP metalloprotease RseP [Smithella sp.]|nr:RIP metalloprotease RseP [Smithella sp.]OQC54218.1 MAG: Metalloprotease MmpA [Deltaproteobacteria bacterium ADurb.Bin022]HPV51477.1 RIP metalloprotease RseP [Smithella sp.]HPX29960.1 RIP metalloprotease RseP [Smithella sp.]